MMTLMVFLMGNVKGEDVKNLKRGTMMNKPPLKKLENIFRRHEREEFLFGKKKTVMEKLKEVIHGVEQEKAKLQRKEKQEAEKVIRELRKMVR